MSSMTALPPPPETPWQIFRDFVCEQAGDDAYVQWLESSGTLERLGEMATLYQHGSHRISPELEQWWRGKGLAITSIVMNPLGYFAQMCEAFGVPPVLVEVTVGIESRWSDGRTAVNHEWAPPSPALATAVLRLAVEVGWKWLHMPYAQQQIGDAAKQNHPNAIAYRLRLLPDGEWQERRL